MIYPWGSQCRDMIHSFNDGQRYCIAFWKEKQSVTLWADGGVDPSPEKLCSTYLSTNVGFSEVRKHYHLCHTIVMPVRLKEKKWFTTFLEWNRLCGPHKKRYVPKRFGVGRMLLLVGFTTPPVFSMVMENKWRMQVAALNQDNVAMKCGTAFTDANTEKTELCLRTLAADRMIQYGNPEGLQAGCTTVIPTQPSCVISQSNLTCQ